jgi:hypothetical protein
MLFLSEVEKTDATAILRQTLQFTAIAVYLNEITRESSIINLTKNVSLTGLGDKVRPLPDRGLHGE